MFGFFQKDSNADAQGVLSDKVLTVNKARCPQNHKCPSIRVCPVGALSQDGYKAPVVDMDKCIKCGKCVRFCPMRALSLN